MAFYAFYFHLLMQATPLCKCLGRHLAVAEVYKNLGVTSCGASETFN